MLCLDFHDSFCAISNNVYFNTSIIEQEESLILIRDCIYVILSPLFRNKGVIAFMHFYPFPDSISFTMQFIAMAETIHITRAAGGWVSRWVICESRRDLDFIWSKLFTIYQKYFKKKRIIMMFMERINYNFLIYIVCLIFLQFWSWHKVNFLWLVSFFPLKTSLNHAIKHLIIHATIT